MQLNKYIDYQLIKFNIELLEKYNYETSLINFNVARFQLYLCNRN